MRGIVRGVPPPLKVSATCVVALFLTGWQPHSRETSLAEVNAAEAQAGVGMGIPDCWQWPFATADLVLQRRQYIPARPGVPVSQLNHSHWPAPLPWNRLRVEVASCVERAASEASALYDMLSADVLSATADIDSHASAPHVHHAVIPDWVGRERSLGSILHSLVPLLWWIALENSTVEVVADGNSDLMANSIARSPAFHVEPAATHLLGAGDLPGGLSTTTWLGFIAGGAPHRRGNVVLRPPVLQVFAGSDACEFEGYTLSCFLHPAG